MDEPPVHTFMVMLESRRGGVRETEELDREYARLTRLAIERFADPSRDHHPKPD